MRDRTQWADCLATLFVLAFALFLACGSVARRPDINSSEAFLAGELGNQLYRADRLARGQWLYRDLASPYGPLSAYPYMAYTRVFGNTILANHGWHMAWSLISIALAVYLV